MYIIENCETASEAMISKTVANLRIEIDLHIE